MKGSVLSIDPGNECGAAIYWDGVLVLCGLVNRADSPGGIEPLRILKEWGLERFDCLVIEIPRISKQTKDPASIVKLAITAGRMIERFPHAKLIYTFVDQWKASVEKEDMCMRIVGHLTIVERGHLPNLAKTYLHNVIDAIGIGLRALGRMARGGRARK
jgi:hypothetical protein